MEKTHTMKTKTLICFAIIIWLFITIVSATTLNPSQVFTQSLKTKLTTAGYNNITIDKTLCSDKICINITGDIKYSYQFPSKVKDNCITTEKIINKSVMINASGRMISVTRPTTMRICTGLYNYRNTLDAELYLWISNAIENMVDNKVSSYPGLQNTINENPILTQLAGIINVEGDMLQVKTTILAESFVVNTPKNKKTKSQQSAEANTLATSYLSGNLVNSDGITVLIPEEARTNKTAHYDIAGLCDWTYRDNLALRACLKCMLGVNKPSDCASDSRCAGVI